jgi:hypothetical protein
LAVADCALTVLAHGRGGVLCACGWLSTFAPLAHDKLVVVASMMHEAIAAAPHGYSGPVVNGAVVVFWVAREYLTTTNLLHCSLRSDKTDSVLDGPALLQLRTMTMIKCTLYGSTSSLHPLGSASWCTGYVSACKRTYPNQPIFMFPNYIGRRFD